MPFSLVFTEEAEKNLLALENPALKKRLKSVRKALGYLQHNPRHPGLNTHKFTSLLGPRGEEMKIKHLAHIEYFGFTGHKKTTLQL